MLKNKILQLLNSNINIYKISIDDLSQKHANHNKSSNGGHFKIHIISNDFMNLSLLNRHKMIYSILDNMLKDEIHALSMKTQTMKEYEK